MNNDKKKPPQSPFSRLFSYARPYRFKMILAAVFTALSTIFDLLPDVLIGIAVDVVVKQQNSLLARLGIVEVKLQLAILGGIACFIWALEAICEYMYAYLWRTVAQSVQHSLRIDTYEHIQQLNMTYYEDVSTGSLVSIVNDDINQLERFLDVGIYKFVYLATTTLAIGSIFFYLAPVVAVCAFLPLPIIVFVVIYFKKRLTPRYAQVRKHVAALANRIANNIMGITIIKSYASEEYELQRLRVASTLYKEANYKAIVLSAAFTPMVRMLIVIAFVATVVLGGWYVLEGYLDVGAYSVLVFQTQRLLWPAAELAEMTDLYERAMASTQRIFGLMDIPRAGYHGNKTLALENVQGALEFCDITFGYVPEIPVFRSLSCSIKAGSTVAFVGQTGAGKSTIIKLLLRFYDPQEGHIALDGVDTQQFAIGDLRRAISLVSQDVFLFHGTVKENISYGSFNASFEAIQNAARIAQAHDFIESLPLGYDTVIGERGQKLSGGQRQRLSIARALLKNSPIFIFDEATSSVDNETELAIQRSLQATMSHNTVIIVAHRLSTICHADTIFVVGNGGIIEAGTHQQLLNLDKVYAQLWRLQTLGAAPGIQKIPGVSTEHKTTYLA